MVDVSSNQTKPNINRILNYRMLSKEPTGTIFEFYV